jgi:ElaB/YqjD/DUF883 family membrane-anchored ribosome-binding protein
MDNQTLLNIMTAFVVIAGLSLVVQVVMLFGVYRSAKTTERKMATLAPKVEALLPQVELLLSSSQKMVDNGRQQILEIAARTNDILDGARRQLAKVEEVVNDASGRARVQLEHAELVLDDTLSRANETVAMVQNGINRPLREIQGITAGVRAALIYLARGNRPSPERATQDDEMFI